MNCSNVRLVAEFLAGWRRGVSDELEKGRTSGSRSVQPSQATPAVTLSSPSIPHPPRQKHPNHQHPREPPFEHLLRRLEVRAGGQQVLEQSDPLRRRRRQALVDLVELGDLPGRSRLALAWTASVLALCTRMCQAT
ncbi:MAG: hypothetical protein QOJ16_384 [Acidobacteriota bacterium]|nr:hypothetical protein [Acidobacteriota bacterium]